MAGNHSRARTNCTGEHSDRIYSTDSVRLTAQDVRLYLYRHRRIGGESESDGAPTFSIRAPNVGPTDRLDL